MQISHPYLDAILDWARHENAIRALVATGSRARLDDTVDDFSDLDIQIIATDFTRYIEDDSWLDQLGDVWIRFPLHKFVPYRLVWFNGGAKVDFQFLAADELNPSYLSDEYKRGYHILLDKDNRFRHLPPSPRVFPQPPLPSVAEFLSTINEFWFEAIHVAQFIRRREFWVVKHRDWTMKTDLLRMLEWHAQITTGDPVNTWLLGRRIALWTDEASYTVVKRLWAGWNATECWDALLQQVDLFQALSQAVAATLRYQHDEEPQRKIQSYIRQLWREDDTNSPTD
jgi:aminoglycoside 6-adenylyltransferase